MKKHNFKKFQTNNPPLYSAHEVEFTKLLGISVNNKLIWKDHFNVLLKKLVSATFAVRIMSSCNDTNKKKFSLRCILPLINNLACSRTMHEGKRKFLICRKRLLEYYIKNRQKIIVGRSLRKWKFLIFLTSIFNHWCYSQLLTSIYSQPNQIYTALMQEIRITCTSKGNSNNDKK